MATEHTFQTDTPSTRTSIRGRITSGGRGVAGCLLALCMACQPPGASSSTSSSSSSSGTGGSSSSSSSSSGQAGSSSSSSGNPNTSSGGGDGGVQECTHLRAEDLEPVVFDLKNDESTGYSMKLKVNLGSVVPDYFVLKFFNYNERTEMPTGTFPLGEGMNNNTGTCAECLNVFVDQLTPDSAPAKLLFQSAGTITLNHDPRDAILRGNVRGLRLVEVTLDSETLSSVPVPGGTCVTVEDLDWDFRYVPETWTCDAAYYNGDDDCDCGCGATDPDCWPDFEEPPPIRGCAEDEQCTNDQCLKTCSTMEPTQSCAEGTCVLGAPQDVCDANPDVIDPAPLGGTCTIGYPALSCAVLAGIQRGACDVEDQTCRPVCAVHSECGNGEHCAQLVVGADFSWKGYCRPGVPYFWTCDAAQWRDNTTCNCGCGMADPDCENTSLPVAGCDGGTCGTDGVCAP